MQFKIKVNNLDRWQKAIQKSPQVVQQEAGQFLSRARAFLARTIQNSPWRLGASGGGAPVDTGNLRDSHRYTFQAFQLTIAPIAPYAQYVHDGTGKMKARPWLAYAIENNEQNINKEAQAMIDRVANKLSV